MWEETYGQVKIFVYTYDKEKLFWKENVEFQTKIYENVWFKIRELEICAMLHKINTHAGQGKLDKKQGEFSFI